MCSPHQQHTTSSHSRYSWEENSRVNHTSPSSRRICRGIGRFRRKSPCVAVGLIMIVVSVACVGAGGGDDGGAVAGLLLCRGESLALRRRYLLQLHRDN
jgi:hypothetical protein